MLFVPADSERKLEKSIESPADALIIDLEDSVAESRRSVARKMAAEYLMATKGKRRWQGFVRINPLTTQDALRDLAEVVSEGVDGIVLPKSNGADDVIRLGNYLDVLEIRAGIEPGSIKVVVVATETAKGVLSLSSYANKPPRMVGITWGAEDLAAALGAISNRDEDGQFSPPYLMARAGALLAASAAEVQAVDTLYADFRDATGLAQDCRRSRRDGFLGRIAIHPDQVEVINRCFTPSEEDIDFARSIVEAFAAAPGVGVVGIAGKMYDRPHLVQAMKTLAQVGQPAGVQLQAA
jgi:citrate lyase subunit beta/citryl-CoA lyase